MSDLLYICFTIIAAILIWKLRQQSEYAKELITQHCYKLDLQLLSVARSSFNFKFGEQFLQASFVFEFSSDNDNNYQGVLFLSGLRKARFELPAYRTYEDPNTLN